MPLMLRAVISYDFYTQNKLGSNRLYGHRNLYHITAGPEDDTRLLTLVIFLRLS